MAQRTGPSWPQGHSIPQNAMLSIQTGGGWLEGADHSSGKRLGIGQWVLRNCIVFVFWSLFLLLQLVVVAAANLQVFF